MLALECPVVHTVILDRRVAVLLLCLLLSCMVVLSSTSSAPAVRISQLSTLDEGSEVRTSGLVADMAVYDSGTQVLVLVDPDDGATVRVFCSPGTGRQAYEHPSIGDRISVQGTVGEPSKTPVIFAESGCVSLLEKAQFALTVDILSANWQLFLGDEFSIRGMLVQSASEAWLSSLSSRTVLSVRCEAISLSPFIGSEVVLSGTLVFDEESLSLFFKVKSVALVP